MDFLTAGQLITGTSKAWLGGFGEIGKPYSYTHPSTKQCDYEAASIPSGVITMWSGTSTNIPEGWLLCNGSNGTPDLRDRFIVGAGNEYSVGATGGEKTHTLTVNEMPSHTHAFTGKAHTHTGNISLNNLTCSEAGAHIHNIKSANNNYLLCNGMTNTSAGDGNGAAFGSSSNKYVVSTNSTGSHTHSISGSGTATINNATATGTNSNTGGSQAHENRPPYYALCFIMKQ